MAAATPGRELRIRGLRGLRGWSAAGLLGASLWLGGPPLRAGADPAPADPTPAASAPADEPVYRQGKASQDGIGKFYMGREISFVMGHAGAEWLERAGREAEEKPEQVIDNLGLAPDAVVADIGAGTGYFSFRIAKRVPRGKVLAVNIEPAMVKDLSKRREQNGLTNVVPVLGTISDPKLDAGSVDLALMVDAYHEFSQPREMMTALVRALRPGGRVVLVEYRGEDASIPIYPLHKLTEVQARREMAAVGLRWRETRDFLPQQHLMIFEKPSDSPAEPTGGKERP